MSAASAPVAKVRRYDIDWLRILAVLLLVPFHTSRIFDIWEPFYVKSAVHSVALSYFIGFVGMWHMPILFVLAGMSTWLALNFRSGGQYAAERFKRLLVPLLFGVLVVVPPQAYLALHKQPGYHATYWQFLSSYLLHPDFSDLSGYFGTFTPAHLWFILFLFVMSLIGLPIFLALHGQRGRRAAAALARFFSLPGTIFLLAIPLTLCEALPALGGMKFFFDFMLVLLGFVLMSDPGYEQTIDRHRLAGLLGGTVASVGILFISLFSAHWADYSTPSIVFAFLRDFNVWFWMIALLGYGRRLLNVGGAALKYLTEAAYPFYILHQTAIIAVGYLVLRWDVPLAVQFVAIMALATAASFAVYDVLIRRVNVMRFLFGMKPLPPRKAPAPESVRQPA